MKNIRVRPFRGLLYNPNIIQKYEDVLVPPYDVISPEEREEYLKKSIYNFTHLTLGKSYDDVERLSHQWKKNRMLIPSKKPCFYLCKESFFLGEEKYRSEGSLGMTESKLGMTYRYGVIAIVKCGDHIIPHEKTFQKYIEDRAQVALRTHLQLSCVFSMFKNERLSLQEIYEKVEKEISTPWIPASGLRPMGGDDNGERKVQFHEKDYSFEMIEVSDPKQIEKIQHTLENSSIYIIDGHHRYAAMNYYHEVQKSKDKYVMMYLTNQVEEGLCVLATHRAVNWNTPLNISHYFENKYGLKYEECLREEGLKKLASSESCLGVSDRAQADVMKVFNCSKLLDFKAPKHLRILEDIFTQYPVKQKDYIRGLAQYEKKLELDVVNGKYDTVFWVSPVSWKEFFDVTDHHETMPQKSTYFYPKILSGTVVYQLN